MSPPLPPSPPSGPPNSTNFSRRKLTAPGPPAPERTKILAWSRKCMARAGYAMAARRGTFAAIVMIKCQRVRRCYCSTLTTSAKRTVATVAPLSSRTSMRCLRFRCPSNTSVQAISAAFWTACSRACSGLGSSAPSSSMTVMSSYRSKKNIGTCARNAELLNWLLRSFHQSSVSILVAGSEPHVQLRQTLFEKRNIVLARGLKLPQIIFVHVGNLPGLDPIEQLDDPDAFLSPVFGAHWSLHTAGHATASRMLYIRAPDR